MSAAAVDSTKKQAAPLELKSYFRKNAIIGTAEIVGRLPLIFIAGYVARHLGPRTYGNWALIIAFAGFVASFTTLFPASLSRLASVSSAGQARGYLRFSQMWALAATALVTLLTLALRPWIADALGLSSDDSWLLLLGCAIIAMSVIEGQLDPYFKARELVARQSALVLVRSAIGVTSTLIAFSGVVSIPGVSGVTSKLLVYVIIGAAMRLVLYPPLVIFRGPRRVKPAPADRRSFVRYGLPMIPAGLVVFLVGQGDRLALGHLFAKPELGVYAFAASLATYVGYLGLVIYPLLLPRASKLIDSGNVEAVQQAFKRSMQVYFVPFALVILALVLFSEEVVDHTAGRAYRGAAAALVLLAAANGIEGLLGCFQWIFQLARRPSLVLWFNIGYAVLNVAGVIVGAWIGGPAAVGVAVLVTTIVADLTRYAIARRLVPVRLDPAVALGLVALAAVSLLAWFGDVRDWAVASRLALAGALLAMCAVAIAGWMRRRTGAAADARLAVSSPASGDLG